MSFYSGGWEWESTSKKKKKEREKEKQLETKPFVFREQCERLSKETNVPFTVPA